MKKIKSIFLFTIQYCFYYSITPLALFVYYKKYPWIICERGNDARDNGYSMFKYLRKEQPYINVYYLIKYKSIDYSRVKALGAVVRYKSFKHWLLYRAAECRMSTHMLFAPGNYIGEWFKHHKQNGINVFLQHGITHNDFPSNYYEHNGSDLFICGAKEEYDHISNECHFPKGNVVYTGFSRFDDLHNIDTKNQILVMPSWRSYLKGLSKEEFVKTDYFKSYDSLLKNFALNAFLQEANVKIVFYIHYSLQEYLDCFFGYNEQIIIADPKNYDVQSLLKDSKLLITDFSSIFFDFAYMEKPLIYYQFDKDIFYKKHYRKSYFDHLKDGFGPVCNSEEQTVKEIIEAFDNDLKVSSDYIKRINKTFPLHDTKNSKRIFDSIIDKIIVSGKKRKLPTNPTYLIFTGDDYGRNKESSLGINRAYDNGFIQQASLMVNRNENDMIGIDHIPRNKVVFHYNVLEGNKTYDPEGEWFFFIDEDGISKRLVIRKTFYRINKLDKDIIIEELRNQIKHYKNLGYQCIAVDSHGHMHNRLPIAKFMIPLCKESGFKVIRIPPNINLKHPLFDLTYKKYVTHLYKKSFITSDYFCSCYDLIHLNISKYRSKIIEVMTHPFMEEQELTNRRDIDFELIRKFLMQFNIKLINYNDLIKLRKNG